MLDKKRIIEEYRIKERITRPNRQLYSKFHTYPTATISDSMESRNTLSHKIKPVWNYPQRLVGPALTVSASVNDELLALKAIELAEPNDIVIIAGNADPHTAYWGGMMSTMAKARKISGLITDGMIRDLQQCEDIEFPIWAKGATPLKPKTNTPPGDLNLPISIDGVIIHPGDLIIADRDGVVVVPQDKISSVESSVIEILSDEEERVQKINNTKEMISKGKVDSILSKRTVKYL